MKTPWLEAKIPEKIKEHSKSTKKKENYLRNYSYCYVEPHKTKENNRRRSKKKN